MSKFSARYARKVQYCDIACRARRKKLQFFLLLPHQSETWIDAPGIKLTAISLFLSNFHMEIRVLSFFNTIVGLDLKLVSYFLVPSLSLCVSEAASVLRLGLDRLGGRRRGRLRVTATARTEQKLTKIGQARPVDNWVDDRVGVYKQPR